MKTKMIQPLIPPQSQSAAFHPNVGLARLIQADSNPYHALHIAKAFALKAPHVDHKPMPVTTIAGNPWENLLK